MFKRKSKIKKEIVRVSTKAQEYYLKPSKGLEDNLIKAWEENSMVWCEDIDGARVLIDCKLIEKIKRMKDYKPRRTLTTSIELDGSTLFLVLFTLSMTTACILSLIWRT